MQKLWHVRAKMLSAGEKRIQTHWAKAVCWRLAVGCIRCLAVWAATCLTLTTKAKTSRRVLPPGHRVNPGAGEKRARTGLKHDQRVTEGTTHVVGWRGYRVASNELTCGEPQRARRCC